MELQNLCKLFKTSGYPSPENIKNIKSSKYCWLSLFHFISLFCVRTGKGNVELAENILDFFKKEYYDKFKYTITLTFGDVAESHVGMQQIGQMAENGFSKSDLDNAAKWFNARGARAFIIHLNNFLPEDGDDKEENKFLKIAREREDFQGYILIVRGGMKCLGDDEGKNLLTEMLFLDWDTKFYHKNQSVVKNKIARHNINFDEEEQIADFDSGKGTTIAFKNVPILDKVKTSIEDAFGESGLKCEGNKYYGKDTGISRHGDTERRKVVGCRLGSRMNMHWTWFYNNMPRGRDVSVFLNPGDIYAMSEKAVGTDWRPDLSKGWKNKRYTVRHAAGSAKYTTLAPKVNVRNQSKFDDDITVGDLFFKPKKSVKNPKPVWDKM